MYEYERIAKRTLWEEGGGGKLIAEVLWCHVTYIQEELYRIK